MVSRNCAEKYTWLVRRAEMLMMLLGPNGLGKIFTYRCKKQIQLAILRFENL